MARTKNIRLLLVVMAVAGVSACGQLSPEELLAEAREAIAAGEPRTAQIHLKNLLRNVPNQSEARALLGQVSLSLNDPVGAEVELRRAIDLGADPRPLQLPLLSALAAQGKFEALLAQVEAGPDLEGEDQITMLRMAGAAHRALGRLDEAEAVYRSALELRPDSASVRTDLASLHLDQDRVAETRAFIASVLTDQPDYAPALLLRGRLEIRDGRYGDAERTMRTVLASNELSDPEHLLAASLLVEMLMRRGAIDEAGEHADDLLARHTRQPVPIVLKASVEIEQGRLDSARARLERLVADMPDNATANALLGSINARQGRISQARMHLQSALARNPADRRALLQLGGIELADGRPSVAIEHLKAAVQPLQAESTAILYALAGRASMEAREEELARRFFDESVRALSGDPQELLTVSAVYAGSGELGLAQDLLEDQSAADAPTNWTATYLLAMTQASQREFETADGTIQRLISLRPGEAWPVAFRGAVAELAQNWASARGFYSAALDVDARHLPALLGLARLAMRDGNAELAEGYLERVLEVEPQHLQALSAMTELALARNDVDSARASLGRMPDSTVRRHYEGLLAAVEGRLDVAADRLAQVFAERPSAQAALLAYTAAHRAGRPNPDAPLRAWLAQHPDDAAVNFALGSAALEQGDYDAALAHHEAVVRAAPDNAAALNNLAWLYDRKGDGRALEMARRAHVLAPDHPAIADTLGWLYVRNGDPVEGLRLLESSIAALPDNPEIRYHHAVALARTGARARAAEELRRLLESDARFEGRDDAQRLLVDLE